MPLEPSHPHELALHEQLRDALNSGIDGPNFFVWIDVEPTGETDAFQDLGSIVSQTARWLANLDPDSAAERHETPSIEFEDRAARVVLRALAKRPEARAKPGRDVVGNPLPVLVGWVE